MSCCGAKKLPLRMWRLNPVPARWKTLWMFIGTGLVCCAIACGNATQPTSASSSAQSQPAAAVAPVAQTAAQNSEPAPPADKTGGFDGAKAFDHVAKIVSFGPRPPASDGIHQVQAYLIAQLNSYGCQVDQDDFNASTPTGNVAMKNIIAKAPGTGQGIILLMTHYDSLGSVKDFVGAEDSASSTGMMLELARLLCARKGPNSVWMAFVDGEEAFVNWDVDNDHTYGSRELAARMAISGDLKRVKALLLADMIGQHGLILPKESDSTKWLADLVWKTAARLGYKDVFVDREVGRIDDDHQSFLSRGVPSLDIIDLNDYISAGYWHTPQDSLDKISARNVAIVGYVLLESVGELQKKFH
jgi:glutaminyl-peptide cyclotransferase